MISAFAKSPFTALSDFILRKNDETPTQPPPEISMRSSPTIPTANLDVEPELLVSEITTRSRTSGTENAFIARLNQVKTKRPVQRRSKLKGKKNAGEGSHIAQAALDMDDVFTERADSPAPERVKKGSAEQIELESEVKKEPAEAAEPLASHPPSSQIHSTPPADSTPPNMSVKKRGRPTKRARAESAEDAAPNKKLRRGRPMKRAMAQRTKISTRSKDIENYFKVKYPVIRDDQDLTIHEGAVHITSPFVVPLRAKDGELDQYIKVTPEEEWNKLPKKKHIVKDGNAGSGALYNVGDFVYVRHKGTPKRAKIDKFADFWIARIEEIRQWKGDATQKPVVLLLVTWLYWPDDLPATTTLAGESNQNVAAVGGRRRWHGVHELVASNYMDIISAESLASQCEIEYWDETTGEATDKLFWRQTFCRLTQELSELPSHCTCKGYFNPDESMIKCTNPACNFQIHSSTTQPCLTNNIKKVTYNRLLDILSKEYNNNEEKAKREMEVKNKNRKKGKGKGKVKGKKEPWKDMFSVEIVEEEGRELIAKITDLRVAAVERDEEWDEEILCPGCGEVLR